MKCEYYYIILLALLFIVISCFTGYFCLVRIRSFGSRQNTYPVPQKHAVSFKNRADTTTVPQPTVPVPFPTKKEYLTVPSRDTMIQRVDVQEQINAHSSMKEETGVERPHETSGSLVSDQERLDIFLSHLVPLKEHTHFRHHPPMSTFLKFRCPTETYEATTTVGFVSSIQVDGTIPLYVYTLENGHTVLNTRNMGELVGYMFSQEPYHENKCTFAAVFDHEEPHGILGYIISSVVGMNHIHNDYFPQQHYYNNGNDTFLFQNKHSSF